MTLNDRCLQLGEGYQTSEGQQGAGPRVGKWKNIHINGKELRAVLLALRFEEELKEIVIHVLSDNTSAVHGINRQGSTKSPPLMKISVDLGSTDIFIKACLFSLRPVTILIKA